MHTHTRAHSDPVFGSGTEVLSLAVSVSALCSTLLPLSSSLSLLCWLTFSWSALLLQQRCLTPSLFSIFCIFHISRLHSSGRWIVLSDRIIDVVYSR